jgi:acetyl esterase/lipase
MNRPIDADAPACSHARPRGLNRRTGLLAALGALLSGCSATQALDRLVARNTYQGQDDVPYGPDPRQRLDLFRPLDTVPAPAAGRPLVVFFYGGSWTRGERAGYRFVGEALAASGAVALVADYRLSPQVRYPDFLRDCALAVKWAFDHAQALGADPARVFIMGHSAGAYNAAMLALDGRWLGEQGLSPRRLAGWIGIAGPYDFLPIGDPEVQVAFNWPATPADSQPLAHASGAAPRTLLLAAAADSLVNPRRNTEGLDRRLGAAGADVSVHLLDGVSHVTVMAALARPLNWLAPVLPLVRDFLGLPAGRTK